MSPIVKCTRETERDTLNTSTGMWTMSPPSEWTIGTTSKGGSNWGWGDSSVGKELAVGAEELHLIPTDLGVWVDSS